MVDLIVGDDANVVIIGVAGMVVVVTDIAGSESGTVESRTMILEEEEAEEVREQVLSHVAAPSGGPRPPCCCDVGVEV